MSVIDNMLEYMESGDRDILITSALQISTFDLNVVVVKMLSWLKLEYKRCLWIAEGKKNTLKPLDISGPYSWCANIRLLIEKEEQFGECFAIYNESVEFSENVSEEKRTMFREKVHNAYNPMKRS